MKRKSTAIWKGTGKEGKGTLTSTSGVLQETPYSFSTRFQNEDGRAGTNPEELIAAAHAGCFSMALAFGLTDAGFPPTQLWTEANVTIEKDENGFTIKSILLEVVGEVPNITAARFEELANDAKKGCPVSRALAAVPISLNAKLK